MALHAGDSGKSAARRRSIRFQTDEPNGDIAFISADEPPSLRRHESLGFTQAGLLRQVGHKFDRWLDVAYLQKIL